MKSKRKKNDSFKKRAQGLENGNMKKKKISKSKRSNKKEKKFVSYFLQQPARTRSGIKYSKRSRDSNSSSNESIFGSISGQYIEEYNKKLRAVKSTSHICQCKQCYEDFRRRKLKSMSCESSHEGLSIILNSGKKVCERQFPVSHPNASSGIRVHNSSPELKMAPGRSPINTEHTASKTIKKRESIYKKTCIKSSSSKSSKKQPSKVKSKANKKTKQQSKTKSKKGSGTKKKADSDKRIRERPRAKSSSLLKFILKKTSGVPESQLSLKPYQFGEKSDDPCTCCARYQKLLREFSKDMMLVKISPKLRKLPARYNLLRLWKPCLQPQSVTECDSLSSESEDTPVTSCRTKTQGVAPMPRAATNATASPQSQIRLANKWQSLSKIVKNIREKRAEESTTKRITELSRPIAPIPSCGIAKKVSKAVKNKKSGGKENDSADHPLRRIYYSTPMSSSVRKNKTKSKKMKHKSASKQKSKRKKRKYSKTQKATKTDKIEEWKVLAARKYRKNEKLRETLNKITNNTLSKTKTPMPSSRVPTFIAMVKTAIRDLEKFHMTSREALSKYIAIRYRVKNDALLKFALKWMAKMGVIEKTNGLYYFTSKRTVTKSKCVGKVRKEKKESKRKKKKEKAEKKGRRGKQKKNDKKNRNKKQKNCSCAEKYLPDVTKVRTIRSDTSSSAARW